MVQPARELMTVPLLDLEAQHAALMPEMRAAFERIVASGRFVLGPGVEAFERRLAAYCAAEHAVGVSSGTDALLLAMMALGVGPGDEVITTPFTFIATAGCIARLGATPVFVDIDARTYNIDPDLIEEAVTDKTKAIMPVHLFGQTADMGPILQVADRHGLAVIEDAAQAIGARDHKRSAGSIGDVGCLSFYPTKNLAGLGDGGACLTNQPDVARRLRTLRTHGQDSKYHYITIGGNFRLDELQAAMLGIKLDRLDGYIKARRSHARRYDQALADTPLILPGEVQGRHHAYNQYTVRVPSGRRDPLRAHLDANRIGHEVYYPIPLHLQPCFAYLGWQAGRFPVAERAAGEVLSLPVYPEMPLGDQDRVIIAIREFFS